MKTDYTLDEEYEIANRPLTDEELAQFRPLNEALPPHLANMLLAHQADRERKGLMKTRGKQKAPTKEVISIRLSPDVLAAFRATGKGWQTRIDDVLRQHMASL